MMKAYASGGSGKPGRKGTVNENMPRGNGMRSMSQYYRRYGVSALGATSKTRGRVATIRPARGR